MTAPAFPLAILAELTHRCPLQCPYCSNPVALRRAGEEIGTQAWCDAIRQAAELGVMHIHFSGGEPTVRRDLETMVAEARDRGLYSNLITAGVLLDRARLAALADAGLDHVQLSVQDADAEGCDRIGGFCGGFQRKLDCAAAVREAGLPLTLNAVVHRRNLHNLDRLIRLAVALDADRLEIAHVQYYGWAYRNRAALMPTREQVAAAVATVEAARERLRGVLVIDHVPPDYYARRPKACMGGWGRSFLNVAPDGSVLPCHAAATIPGLRFERIGERSLREIWDSSEAFRRFRGTDWMPEPCRGCDRREIDWGGCRCQALALTGRADRTDPACALSPDHAALVATADGEAAATAPPAMLFRNFANAARS